MFQAVALTTLVNQTPFNQLIGGLYSSIWITKQRNGYIVSGRGKSDDAVVQLAGSDAPARAIDLDGVLGGTTTIDVEVGGVAYGITKLAIGGRIEYVMTEHTKIPRSARGVPSVVI